jgi:hypothetical protein
MMSALARQLRPLSYRAIPVARLTGRATAAVHQGDLALPMTADEPIARLRRGKLKIASEPSTSGRVARGQPPTAQWARRFWFAGGTPFTDRMTRGEELIATATHTGEDALAIQQSIEDNFGPNRARLTLIKKLFDPDNVFRLNARVPSAKGRRCRTSRFAGR